MGGDEKEPPPKAGAPKDGFAEGVLKGDAEAGVVPAVGVCIPEIVGAGVGADMLADPASSLETTSLAAAIPAYAPPCLLTTLHADSVPSVAYDHTTGVATSPAFSSADGASVADRSTSKPSGNVSRGRVVYRSFLTCDQTILSLPSSTGA